MIFLCIHLLWSPMLTRSAKSSSASYNINYMWKEKKCKFHQCIISFLVYIISPDGVSIDQSTVAAIINWPTPWTFKDLKQLLGFVNFYSYFILAFSSIAYPLTSLLQGGSKHLAWHPTTDVRSDPDKNYIYHSSHPKTSWPFQALHSQGWCLWKGSGCHSAPEVLS